MRVAAARADTGAVLPLDVRADARVLALALSPDGGKLVVGGHFTTLNGSSDPGFGFGAVSTSTGAIMPWNINREVRQASVSTATNPTSAAIYSLKSDATGVYGTAYMYPVSGKTLEGAFRADWANGDIVWLQTCKGDSYDVAMNSDTVYLAGHPHDCSEQGEFPDTNNPKVYHRGMAWTKTASGNGTTIGEFAGNPSPKMLNWWPDFTAGAVSGATQGPWSVAATDDYVVFAGEFPRVNNIGQQGIVRFASRDIAPNDDGPRVTGSAFVPTVTPAASGAVNVRWLTNWDRDNQFLTYEVYRNGTANRVYGPITMGSRANFDRPVMSFTDSGLTPGSTHTYRVRATDPFGNTVIGDAVTATVPSAANSAYANTVLGDTPASYWRLGDASGNFLDWAGANSATPGTGISRGSAGAIGGDSNPAATFPGTAAGVATARQAVTAPTNFAVESWFRTTSTTGGNIVDLGSATTITTTATTTTPASTSNRNLFIDGTGRVSFGLRGGFGGGARLVSSTATGLNDGQWHHAVGSVGPRGMELFVDGRLVAINTTATTAGAASGYWRIGGDNALAAGGPTFLAGAIDEVAVYDAPLTLAQVTDHYTGSGRQVGGTAPNVAPTAAFTRTQNALALSVDASTSSDTDGTIASYSWNFGDNTTGTGVTTSHTYAAAGRYTVTLTVTDNRGASSVSTATVNVTTNQVPTASFTTAVSNLGVTVDASASTDADGTIASYSWNFGDGSNTFTGARVNYSYARAGTYTITLTVQDDLRATSTTTRTVTVGGTTPPANVAPVARFTSSTSGLTASVNASTSTDSDGTIASYAWNFGDGSTGTGATATRTYAAAGTYTVTLTATDDDGATDTETGTVTVTAPTTPPTGALAVDSFGRTITGGLGTAETGGAWTLSSGSTNYAVTDGQARITTPAGSTRYAYLAGVSSVDTDAQVSASLSQRPTAGSAYVGVIGRRVGSLDYRARAIVSATGSVQLQLQQTATTLTTSTVSGLTVNAGEQLRLRLEVTGSSPTTIRAKVWKVGTAEPSTWVSTTDSTAGLQTAGSIGLYSYLSASGTPSPVTVSFDDLRVARATTGAEQPVNVAPVARFTSSTSGLTASVNASTSTDSDGTIASYAWNFGDGSTGTGATATRTYAAAGTYTVTLTATDDDGATDTETGTVTVTAPTTPPAGALATDTFTRTATGNWGTANTGGAWTNSSSTTSYYSVANGVGRHTASTAGRTIENYLPGVTSTNADVQATFSITPMNVGGSVFASVIGRRVGTEDYRTRAVVGADGAISLRIYQGGTTLDIQTITGVTYSAGDQMRLRIQVTGTAPTTIRAKIWEVGTTEPAAWQVEATDTTATLQQAGHAGISSYIGTGVTSLPLTVSWDDFAVSTVQ
ncbi:PKD domain-containing protein [Microbacteriaceae bacterium 4G12]